MADDSSISDPVHPHDAALPPAVVRKRRKNRFFAHWMLLVAVLTATPGWVLYGFSIRLAHRSGQDATLMVIAAYALLIVSTITLVLGLWYLLLAQVRRIARMAGVEELEAEEGASRPLCGNCGWFFDPPDRFCRHCGKPLSDAIPAPRDGYVADKTTAG